MVLTEELYQTANKGFMRHLTKWLNKYTYQLTFGQSQAGIKKPPANSPPDTNTTINHIHTPAPDNKPDTPKDSGPPSYSQVVTEGGAAGPANPKTHIPAADKVLRYPQDKPPPLDKIAPTGKYRTWHILQKTNPQGGPRVLCADPPPAECTDNRCLYYGDWLDVQNICTYCLSTEHQKPDCQRHKLSVAAWQAKHPRQENYRTPAQ